MAPIHTRMPAILMREDEDHWISGKTPSAADLTGILAPHPACGMVACPVLPPVNNPANNDERGSSGR